VSAALDRLRGLDPGRCDVQELVPLVEALRPARRRRRALDDVVLLICD
jgi:hypothetical protein